MYINLNRAFFNNGLKHNKKEYKTKPMSPIKEKCSCGSGSFLMRKIHGKEIFVCRKCANRVR